MDETVGTASRRIYTHNNQEITMPSILYRRAVVAAVILACPVLTFSQNPADCSHVPDHSKLQAAPTAAVKEGKGKNGGFGNQEWGT
ncbi:MAG: hypothetical protein ACXVK3_17735 [Candidatus Angelobacter sp.]